jgi:hypothetical protein
VLMGVHGLQHPMCRAVPGADTVVVSMELVGSTAPLSAWGEQRSIVPVLDEAGREGCAIMSRMEPVAGPSSIVAKCSALGPA